MYKSSVIFFILGFLAISETLAQKEGNIWYFGSHAGLDFNNGAPVALQNSALWNNDNSSTISDTNGQLLFYTNSDTVWNRLHQIMPGGTGLHGSTSSGQCAIIMPQPGSSKYFIFTNSHFTLPLGLSYSVVDMAVSGGYGAVVLKNIQLFPNTTEKLDAIYNPSDNSYWIITHPFESSYFNVYKLTSTGLSISPVISDLCALYTGGNPNGYNAIGQMTISPDGNTIASGVLSSGFIELCDFNRATGQISKSRIIPDFPNAWGIAFSPDSKKLYATRWWSDSVFQFSLIDTSLSSIIASKILIGHATASNEYNYQAGYMQLGPDNRIYITRYQTHYLAVITSPNLDGLDCGFVNDGVFLGAKTSTAGLSRVPAKPDVVFAAFTAPDTVCVGTQVNITNQSTPGGTYYWSFCSGNALSDPVGTNIGNPGNLLNVPGYITQVKDGGTCYSFITNQGGGYVVRYNHGTSFNNNPVSWTNLGGFGMLDDTTMGIKIRYDNGQWIGFVNNNNRIVRLNFGNSLANTPAATLLGPYALLNVAHCLDIFKEGSTWVAYISCSTGNKLVRLNFGNSLLNSPVLTDLGAPGSMNLPGSFRFINENGTWYGLVVNMGNSTMTRLTFGSTLLNNPTGVNLGIICPSTNPGGIALIRDCENTAGFYLNYSISSPDLIWRLNFSAGITGPITGTSLGNIGAMSRPAHFSELFREGDTLFLYNTNRQNFTLTRLMFPPCTNASVPSSTLYNPPPFSYSLPGTYNVQLIVNEGLPDQASLCKSIVVMPAPLVNLGSDHAICPGTTTTLDAGAGFYSYLWSTGATTQTITTGNAGSYWVRVTNYGCEASDTIAVSLYPVMPVNLGANSTICDGQTITFNAGYCAGCTYSWSNLTLGLPNISTGPTYTTGSAGIYSVIVTSPDGCISGDTIQLFASATPTLTTWPLIQSICSGNQVIINLTSGVPGTSFSWTVTVSSPDVTGCFPGNGSVIRQTIQNSLGVGQTVTYHITPFIGNCLGQVVDYVVFVGPYKPVMQYIDTTLCFGTPWHAGGAWQTTPGIYYDTIHVAGMCDSIILTTLKYKPGILISLGTDTIICKGIPIVLNTHVKPAQYKWQDGSFDSVFTATVAGIYWVTVTQNGCSASDSIHIVDCLPPLWFPNIITPNGDGYNETFHPVGEGIIHYNIVIFDRWGIKVFESDAMLPGWDGTFGGDKCSNGVYLYIASYQLDESSGETYHAKGSVTLLR